jgi:hypothetical protein
MKRARVIIEEMRITRQGEIKNFQIKIPKNTKRIIAIDTDVRINTQIPGLISGGVRSTKEAYASAVLASESSSSDSTYRSKLPYLIWNPRVNPPLGKLKLRSRERTNIFYEEWLHFIQFNAGIPDMSIRLFDLHPASLNKNNAPKKVDVPSDTTLINGLFEEYFGKLIRRDLDYSIKIFVWLETEEDAAGLVFDFQEEEKETEVSENKKCGECKCEKIRCEIKCEMINVK